MNDLNDPNGFDRTGNDARNRPLNGRNEWAFLWAPCVSVTPTMRIAVAIVAVLVALGGVAAMGPALAASDQSPATIDPTVDGDELSLGAEISGFMHASDDATAGAVDEGMFDVTFDAADNETQGAVVENRTHVLEQRLDELEAEYAELNDSDDDLPEIARTARLASLATQIENLERAIDNAEAKAVEVGVDTERLDELRTNASDLAGPEVAAIAQQLAGVTSPPGQDDNVTPPGQDDNVTPPTQGDDDAAPGPPDDAGPSDDTATDDTTTDDPVTDDSDDGDATDEE